MEIIMSLCQLRRLAIVLFILISCTIVPSNAQDPPPRDLDSIAFTNAKLWLDHSNSMFQKKYTALKTVPPYSTDMPYEILLSYIYLDSLLRNTDEDEQDSVMREDDDYNDTLKGSAKYLYMINDYNPIIFNQYIGEVHLRYSYDNTPGYHSSLQYLKTNIASKIASLAPQNKRDALFSLLYADYILKIRIIGIEETPDKRIISGVEAPDSKRYRVYAQVLDNIKGKVYTEHIPPPTSVKQTTENDSPEVQSTKDPIITFQYIKMNYFPRKGVINDEAFSDVNGGFNMQVGQEAVVFLTHENQLFDNYYDYFDLDLEILCSNNALPIINGNVRDVNTIWSLSVLRSYADWKTSADILIQTILNGSY
jgi:hypothetical protein